MIKRVSIYYRSDTREAVLWARKIEKWLKKNYSGVKLNDTNPQALIVLGGDGTILAAAQKYQKRRPVILGLNLGHIGFLASAREPKNFFCRIFKRNFNTKSYQYGRN